MSEHRNSARRRSMLEATIRIVGANGASAVTHRAVAAEAHVPLAATTYYFASKQDLLVEALRYAVDAEKRKIERLSTDFVNEGASIEQHTAALAHVLASQLKYGRVRLLVEYELMLEAARTPALRAAVRELNDGYARFAERVLQTLGSEQPARDGRLVVAALDGMLLDQLAAPRPRFESEVLRPALARLLRSLAEAGTTTSARDQPA